MNTKISTVEFVYDDLDCIVIPARYFQEFDWEVDPNAVCFTEENAINFILSPDANVAASGFGGDLKCIFTGEKTLFTLLQEQSIKRVKLTYTDSTEADISVAWRSADKNGRKNALQVVCICEDGAIRVHIST